VVADYHGIRYVDASTSQANVASLGQIRPEDAPYGAVDGDPRTGWTTAFPTRPLGQWLSVRYDTDQRFREVRIRTDPDPRRANVLRWRVSAGGRSVLARVDTDSGLATADLKGVSGRTLRVTVAAVGKNTPHQIAVREIEAAGLPVERSLVVPPVRTSAPTAYLFRSAPETRPCVPTLVAPDCDPNRYRPAEEATGIDREVTLDRAGSWTLTGTVVARSDPATMPLLDPFAGAVTMHASSTYYNDPSVSARMAYDGTPATSWIADPNDANPVLVVDFSMPRRISRMSIAPPASPGVAPASATIVAGDETRTVDLGGFSTFEPLVAQHLEITFRNPTRAGRPIGLGDLTLGRGRTAIPLDGAAKTGAYCGFGPVVHVDGQRRLTRVDGLVGDVASSGPLSFSLCGDPLTIGAGKHRVRVSSTPQFQPVRVVLAEPGAFVDSSSATGGSTRSLKILRETATSRDASVGAGGAALLVTRGNWNRGWTATLDGKPLDPQRIDGWAQGWRVPAGAGGRIEVRYGPQRVYLVGLIGGLALAALMLLLAAVVAVRTRLRPTVEPTPVVRGRRRGRAGRATATILLVGSWVVAGLPGLVGTLIAQLPGARSRKLALAAVLVTAGSVVTAVSFLDKDHGFVPDLADVLAGAGALLALVIGLTGYRDERP